MTGMDTRDSDLRTELHATLQARRELGEEYDSALVDSFLEQLGRRIDGVVDRQVRRGLAEQQTVMARGARSPRATDSWGERFGFGIVSLVLAVPLSAIGGGIGHLPGLLITWAGLVGVNVVQVARVTPGMFRRGGRSSRETDRED
ncbi:hypothetical protein AB0C59_14775 [Streptomyces sp. NPDC048664]|uniref:hypothetical protein n=1 Tax=Streptomyces sp. NPDC048664 TaxID=3154505 RepID=UPI00342DB8B0